MTGRCDWRTEKAVKATVHQMEKKHERSDTPNIKDKLEKLSWSRTWSYYPRPGKIIEVNVFLPPELKSVFIKASRT